ncbi:hypothetical protein K502DRAFT_326180, partial [Neoconidiobolus thromboides FSU 785]
MPLRFDELPDILLEAIFKQLNSEELFNYRFLNKYLFKVINYIIKYNLTYSVYYVGKYINYQQKFIENYGSLMKHINIGNNNFGIVNICPNLISLAYERQFDDFNEEDDNDSEDKSNIGSSNGRKDNKLRIKIKLPNLKKISISSIYYLESLGLFKDYLNQIDTFEIIGDDIIIKDVVQYLNSTKLQSFKLYSFDYLDLDGLDRIKIEFTKLKLLQMETTDIIATPAEFNPNFNFISNLKLQVRGEFNDFDITCFGNLKKLKSVELVDFSGSLFEVDDSGISNMKLIQDSNVTTLGHLNSKAQFNEFMKLTTLKEIYIKKLSIELLNFISLLSNVHKIYIEKFDIKARELFIDSIVASKINECKFIKKIEIEGLHESLKTFKCFLSIFPNLEIVIINNFAIIKTNQNTNYKYDTPLLFIAPDRDDGPYNDIIRNPMIDWLKL